MDTWDKSTGFRKYSIRRARLASVCVHHRHSLIIKSHDLLSPVIQLSAASFHHWRISVACSEQPSGCPHLKHLAEYFFHYFSFTALLETPNPLGKRRGRFYKCIKSLSAFNPDNSKSITGHLLHVGSKNFIHMILLYNKRDLAGSLFIINIKCLIAFSLFKERAFFQPKEKQLLISGIQVLSF